MYWLIMLLRFHSLSENPRQLPQQSDKHIECPVQFSPCFVDETCALFGRMRALLTRDYKASQQHSNRFFSIAQFLWIGTTLKVLRHSKQVILSELYIILHLAHLFIILHHCCSFLHKRTHNFQMRALYMQTNGYSSRWTFTPLMKRGNVLKKQA